MPYNTTNDLPEDIRTILPEHAQEIYVAAYNSATELYKDDSRLHATAWEAVKKEYRESEHGTWVRNNNE